jgi:hypothetical protein
LLAVALPPVFPAESVFDGTYVALELDDTSSACMDILSQLAFGHLFY